MASVERKWLAPVLIALDAAAALIIYRTLPPLIDVRLESLFPPGTFAASQPLAREFLAFGFPILAMLVWAAFSIFRREGGQSFGRALFRNAPAPVTTVEQFERFGATYDTIVLGVVLVIVGLHAAALSAALQHPLLAARLLGVSFGASLVLMGNVMPRLRPNWVAGLRTRRTLADPQLWRSAHRTFGIALVASGLFTTVVSIATPRYGFVAGLGTLILSCVIGGAATRHRPNATPAVALLVLGLLSVSSSVGGAQTLSGSTPTLLPTPPSVSEAPYSFVSNGLELKGTLALPSALNDKPPVVLIVAGSGPTDRNANGPLTNTNAYAMLAWRLAEHGIASLRYDKRGIGESGVWGGDPTKLSMDDYVADVAAAAAHLASTRRFSRVFLLGHSEGAGLVLLAANRGTHSAGVIMVAPQGRRLAEVLHDQFALQLDSATVTKIDSSFARYLRGEDPGDVPPVAQAVVVPAYRNYMRSMAAYDPPAEARRLEAPLLILRGSTDIQVSLDDANKLVAAQPRATFVSLAGANHVLKLVASEALPEQKASLKNPSMPLAPSVIPAIVSWIEAHKQ